MHYWTCIIGIDESIIKSETEQGEGLETEVTSNYIRITPGLNRGCVSNVGTLTVC